MSTLMVIGSSNVGGAEKQFARLVEELRTQSSIAVLLIGKSGPFRSTLRDLEVQQYESSGTVLSDVFTTLLAIWRFRPNSLLLWLYRANVIGSIAGRLLRVPNIVITARNTNWPKNTFPKRLLIRLSSRLASVVVANSDRAALFHQSIGIPSKKMRVIRNFIAPVESVERGARKISVFGIAARAVEGKGHFLAIDALNEVSKFIPSLKLSIIGYGVNDWIALREKLQRASFEFELLEGTLDLSTWFNRIDVCLALADSWDSDSNVVLEAICNRVPVICTESQRIEDLGESMLAVEPLTLESLCATILMTMNFDGRRVMNQSNMNYLKLLKCRDPRHIVNLWNSALWVSRD